MHHCNKKIKKIINYDNVTNEIIKEHNINCAQIPDHPQRILIIDKTTNDNNYSVIDKTYLLRIRMNQIS